MRKNQLKCNLRFKICLNQAVESEQGPKEMELEKVLPFKTLTNPNPWTDFLRFYVTKMLALEY